MPNVYFRQNIAALGHHVAPPVAPLNGLQLMRGSRAEAVMRAQDHVVGLSRRIVASGGLRGCSTWRTPDTDPTLGSTHPTPNERRVIGAGAVDLTPGCFLRAWVLYVPSGETWIDMPIGMPDQAGGPQGRLEVECVWTDRDGTQVTTTSTTILEGSDLTYGAEPSTMWSNLYAEAVVDIHPPGLLPTDELARWCRHVNVSAVLYAVGGARVVDAVLFEHPHAIALEADDSASLWCSHLYGVGSPAGPSQPLAFPYQRFSETTPDGNPRGGTWMLADVHHAQHQRLGPVLFSWSAAVESSGSQAFTTTSTTLTALNGGGSTSFDLDEPGLAVGTGGYARRHASNSPFVLRDGVAAIPVIVRVLASSGVASSVVRAMTRWDSYIDVTIATGSTAWHRAQGWLEVGINPDDSARLVAQLFGRHTTGGINSLSVYAITVHYAGGYVPAQ